VGRAIPFDFCDIHERETITEMAKFRNSEKGLAGERRTPTLIAMDFGCIGREQGGHRLNEAEEISRSARRPNQFRRARTPKP
jgi:hypothetical protein